MTDLRNQSFRRRLGKAGVCMHAVTIVREQSFHRRTVKGLFELADGKDDGKLPLLLSLPGAAVDRGHSLSVDSRLAVSSAVRSAPTGQQCFERQSYSGRDHRPGAFICAGVSSIRDARKRHKHITNIVFMGWRTPG